MKEKEAFVRQFREIQPKFSRFYARLLIQADLSLPQFALLNQLLDRPPLSMTEASQRLHISKPAVTHLVDRLEERKFLRRLAHPKDRRVTLLEILPKGQGLVRKAQGQVLEFVLRALEGLDAAEQKVITRFYAKLSQNIDAVFLGSKAKRK